MNRVEHLQWCKDRANKELNAGDPQSAFMSMISDLRKNDELKDHMGITLGMMLMMNGFPHSEVEGWINGFN